MSGSPTAIGLMFEADLVGIFAFLDFRIASGGVGDVRSEVGDGLIRCIDRDILRPIAELNFGRAVQYQISPRSLVETYSAMFGTREQVRTPRQTQDPVTAGETKSE